jgi:hypothetical protein
MPERLNFSLLLEIRDDEDIRAELIQCICKTFRQWFGGITEISPLDYKNPRSDTSNLDTSAALRYHLGDSEILSFYFTGMRSERQAVLNISKNVPDATVYTISLPDADLIGDHLEMSSLLLGLLSGVRAQGLTSAVAAGRELGIEMSIHSIADLIMAASSPSSLIEYLCFSRKNSEGLARFTLAVERDDMLVFRRGE